MKEISTEELQKRIENGEELNLIDVREDEEIAAGKIPQAEHIRLGTIPESVDKLDKNKQYIMICRSGGRSANACLYLESLGFDVVNMVGGMLDWKGEQS
jgi:rhodanese-related sulfurtransferase